MLKIALAALLSAAFISLAGGHPVNNLEPKASALTQQAGQESLRQSAPAKTVKQEEKLAPAPKQETPKVQTVAQGCDAYRGTFTQYQWDVNTAIAICKAESNGNILAISPTQDRGLMQINSIHADMVNGNLNALYDPATNISVAHRVYLSQGWNGWTTYISGKYLSYL